MARGDMYMSSRYDALRAVRSASHAARGAPVFLLWPPRSFVSVARLGPRPYLSRARRPIAGEFPGDVQ
jgi:hypothetical protein